jgi:hypothetical protein
MGRAKVFKQDQVLSQAMNVFWVKGYDKTSLKDLLSEITSVRLTLE